MPDNKASNSVTSRRETPERRNKERRHCHRGDAVDRRYHDLPRRWSITQGL
ncbi:MAG: hypothetical protein HOH26_11635 [Alphaproteobacteria bacterium]|nr:hypothetical protein [Alphaproteobacteria bacterium]